MCLRLPIAKQAPIHIQVDDQLPIANNEDIEINRLKIDGAEVEKDTGREILWDLQVEAGSVRKTNLSVRNQRRPKKLYVQIR